jgi:6-phosphogluconolactonase
VSEPQVYVSADSAALARSAADRLAAAVVAAQEARGTATVVLTGGRVGTAVLAELAELAELAGLAGGSSAAPGGSVDWRRLDLWWGDERFLPAGHPDRNETQARAALLDRVPLDPGRVHPMPASDGPDGDDLDAAAARYADELAAAAGSGGLGGLSGLGGLPTFDVLLLGVGPDAHVASLFPEHAALHEAQATVVGVRESPKPPPLRTSMTMPTIRSAAQVWLLAAGAEKSEAIQRALSGADGVQVPAAGARGRTATLFLLDEAAAAALPPGQDRTAVQ